jgi:hypothetical protein
MRYSTHWCNLLYNLNYWYLPYSTDLSFYRGRLSNKKNKKKVRNIPRTVKTLRQTQDPENLEVRLHKTQSFFLNSGLIFKLLKVNFLTNNLF